MQLHILYIPSSANQAIAVINCQACMFPSFDALLFSFLLTGLAASHGVVLGLHLSCRPVGLLARLW